MTALRQRLAQGQVAVMMMTRLPAGSLPRPVPTLGQAAWAYPLTGLITGAALWALLTGAALLGLAPLAAALVGLTGLALLTGGLHHDGLADFADGMGGGRDRAHVLEIMRDSRIGSYGVIALILALGLQAAALAETAPQLAALILIAVASRLAMTAGLILLPPARTDGLGQSATAPWPALLPGALLTALLILTTGPQSLLILLAMALATTWCAHRAHRRIGGQTGDVLGAMQMTSETAGLLTLAALV